MNHDPEKLRILNKILTTLRANDTARGPILAICGNSESLQSRWIDLYEAAGFTEGGDFADEVGNLWYRSFVAHMESLIPAASYWSESGFTYWNGGPGQAARGYHRRRDIREFSNCYGYFGNFLITILDECASVADAAAREGAARDIAGLLEFTP